MSGGGQQHDCLFCWAVSGLESEDEERLVLYRGALNFVIINKYPYNNGHLMIAPFAHVAGFEEADHQQLEELMVLARACTAILQKTYRPDGFNIGMNIGRAAGAGVVDHQHLHVVPRWEGDANFLTTVNETRVVPETPEHAYERLRPAFVNL